jgi:hypothetical protein
MPSIGFNYIHIIKDKFSEKQLFEESLLIDNWYDESNLDYLKIPVLL